MDEGDRGALIVLGVCLLMLWGHYGRGSLARAIRDLMGPVDTHQEGPMAVKREKFLGHLETRDEAGNVHMLSVHAHIISNRTLTSGPDAERVSDVLEFRSADGNGVDHLGKGQYRLHTGEVVTCDDPDAP